MRAAGDVLRPVDGTRKAQAVSANIELDKTYSPEAVESVIYELWEKRGCFQAVPDDRPPDRRYVIMIPLPNVTGALHLGHAINNSLQDIMIRLHRMKGHNALWQPGTDHAGIARLAPENNAVFLFRLRRPPGIEQHVGQMPPQRKVVRAGPDGLAKRQDRLIGVHGLKPPCRSLRASIPWRRAQAFPPPTGRRSPHAPTLIPPVIKVIALSSL